MRAVDEEVESGVPAGPVAARGPWALILTSAAGAGLALAAALWSTRAAPPDVWYGSEHLALTPERAAETFLEAYQSGALDRAAQVSAKPLSRKLLARAARGSSATKTGSAPAEHRSFVVQESHRLDDLRLRLLGVLVREGEPDSAGTPVSLTLIRDKSRYVVQEFEW